MKDPEIIQQRLINQQIAACSLNRPEQVVSSLIAMQAQEYAMAKWSIGLRSKALPDAVVEQAFNAGTILRTHLMRPTWHFVTPGNIRWMLALTAPRVHAANAFMYRKLKLDDRLFKKSNDVIAKSLSAGHFLTRTEIQASLARKKMHFDGLSLGYVLMHAELDGIICSGPRKRKQFTYALLEERVPEVKTVTYEESLAIFINEYFSSRGPATLHDFTYWSGLTMKEAMIGATFLKENFERRKVNGKEYIMPPAGKSVSRPATLKKSFQKTFLMPDYDEYGMSYKDRSAIIDPAINVAAFKGQNPVYNRMIIINGKIAGTWNRVLQGKKLVIETFPFFRLNKTDQQQLDKAIKRYRQFLEA